MQINLWKKGFVCGIIVLFIGTSVVSSIVQSDNEIVLVKKIQPIEIGGYGAQSPNEIGSLIVGSWWNINWMYRKQITINYTQVAGNLVNFPVLVITTMDASKVQNDGDDIVFTDNDGIKLNHEIELYDSSTGKLIAWVNITRLSSTTNTKIWMYYGNAATGNQQNKYGTWNSKYKAVYHLDETKPPYVDSTSNKNNITSANVNGSGMAQSGGIYKWQHFNGTSNRFVLPFSVTGTYTLEAIANTDSVASSEVLMGYGLTTSSPYPGVVMGISAASNALFIGNSNNEKVLSPTATYVTAKTSHWWSDVYGSNISLLFYLDGINYTASLSNMNFFNDAASYYTIGARYYSSSYSLFWKGCIDEVRISSGAWNASWIQTCYNNQKDPTSFYSLGSQEHVPSASTPPVFGTPTPTNGSTNNPISFTWSIPINDPEGNTFSWTIQCSNKQGNSGTGATNGTKTLALSGLAYLTIYKVWVNATDPAPVGSGQWTKRWYTFTTKSQPWSNRQPTFSNPSPVNGSTGVNRYHATNITVSDLDGNNTLVCLWYGSSISGPWTKAQQNTSVVANTTVRDINSSYSNGWSTQYWWKATAYDGHANSSVVYTFTTPQQNIPPNKPNKPSGNNSGKIKIVYTYTTSTTDLNGDQVYYMWDWGDGNNSGWLGPYSSGVTAGVTYKWTVKGSYSIKVKAKDVKGAESGWSDPLSIKMPYSFDKPIFQFLDLLFQRFPHIFPIIRHILWY